PLRTDGKLDVGGAVGRDGTLTVIRDDGENEPYSGSVALVSGEIAEDFTLYLAQSEQQGAACALGVLVGGDGAVRAAGGYIISLLPNAPEDITAALERNIRETGEVTKTLDGGSAETLIARILRGMNPRIVSREPVEYRCYCSRERVLGALAGLGGAERADILRRGEPVEVTCRFCDAVYTFTPEEAAGKKEPDIKE
ncbi:MAG: Hsp33 family molecular chaperone HslO, partial [Oscillospiraceae bacterium]|nr:Hsp33 family molecular chaperone HslO [Oscillospiraceae bacterium]